MDGKRIRCLQIVSHHVPIYLQLFPSYSNRKCKKSPFSRTAAHIFVSPGDAPATMTPGDSIYRAYAYASRGKKQTKTTESPTVSSRGQTTVLYCAVYNHDRLIIIKRRSKKYSIQLAMERHQNDLQRSLKVIRNVMVRYNAYDFLLPFHSNYGPTLYCFLHTARYWSKI